MKNENATTVKASLFAIAANLIPSMVVLMSGHKLTNEEKHATVFGTVAAALQVAGGVAAKNNPAYADFINGTIKAAVDAFKGGS